MATRKRLKINNPIPTAVRVSSDRCTTTRSKINWVNKGVIKPNIWINMEAINTSNMTTEWGFINSKNCQKGVDVSFVSLSIAVGCNNNV